MKTCLASTWANLLPSGEAMIQCKSDWIRENLPHTQAPSNENDHPPAMRPAGSASLPKASNDGLRQTACIGLVDTVSCPGLGISVCLGHQVCAGGLNCGWTFSVAYSLFQCSGERTKLITKLLTLEGQRYSKGHLLLLFYINNQLRCIKIIIYL